MKCPFCGQEMEEGAIQSVLDMYWVSEPAHIRKPSRAKGGERLQPDAGFFQFPFMYATRCRSCECIIVKK